MKTLMLKVSVIKTKSATIAFFSSSSSPPFLLLDLCFCPFLFVRYYDFGASLGYENCLLTPFHSNDYKFRRVVFKKKNRLDIYVKK